MGGEGALEILDLSEGLVADAELLGDLVGCGGFGVGILSEHAEIHIDDGFLVCHDDVPFVDLYFCVQMICAF